MENMEFLHVEDENFLGPINMPKLEEDKDEKSQFSRPILAAKIPDSLDVVQGKKKKKFG